MPPLNFQDPQDPGPNDHGHVPARAERADAAGLGDIHGSGPRQGRSGLDAAGVDYDPTRQTPVDMGRLGADPRFLSELFNLDPRMAMSFLTRQRKPFSTHQVRVGEAGEGPAALMAANLAHQSLPELLAGRVGFGPPPEAPEA